MNKIKSTKLFYLRISLKTTTTIGPICGQLLSVITRFVYKKKLKNRKQKISGTKLIQVRLFVTNIIPYLISATYNILNSISYYILLYVYYSFEVVSVNKDAKMGHPPLLPY